MECPACKRDNADKRFRCDYCNYGIRPVPAPTRPLPPRYIGDDGAEEFDARLARTYRCSNCRSFGANVKRIAPSGNVLGRPINWPYQEFIAASCHYCGLAQLFDPQVLDQNQSGWKSLDFLREHS